MSASDFASTLAEQLRRLGLAELAELDPRRRRARPARPTAARAPGRAGRRRRAAPGRPGRGASGRRSARSTRGRPSGGRRAPAPAACPRRAAPAGRAPPGARGSARRPPRCRPSPSAARSDGKMPPSSSSSSGVPVLVRIARGDVGVQRVHPHAERHVLLELRGGARQHQVAALLRPSPQLGEQAGLADARLALHGQAGAATPSPSASSAASSRSSSGSRPTVCCRPEGHPMRAYIPTSRARTSGSRFRGVAPMFGGRFESRLAPCSRTQPEET